MARIEHWPEIRQLVIWLREDVEAPWGSEVMPGITVHYGNDANGERLPAMIEISEYPGMDLSGLSFEERDEEGNVALPAMLAQTMDELVKRGLVERAKAASPQETQKR